MQEYVFLVLLKLHNNPGKLLLLVNDGKVLCWKTTSQEVGWRKFSRNWRRDQPWSAFLQNDYREISAISFTICYPSEASICIRKERFLKRTWHWVRIWGIRKSCGWECRWECFQNFNWQSKNNWLLKITKKMYMGVDMTFVQKTICHYDTLCSSDDELLFLVWDLGR